MIRVVAGRHPRRLARVKAGLRGHWPADPRCEHHNPRRAYPHAHRQCPPCLHKRAFLRMGEGTDLRVRVIFP